MIIKSIFIKEGFNIRNIEFEKKSLIYSNEGNTHGKTTLVRIILHALGFYGIPNTSGINFDNIETKITLKIDSKIIVLTRMLDVIHYKTENTNVKFYLPNDQFDLHSVLFNTLSLEILRNILGVMYIDQMRPNVLSSGRIIGQNFFNVQYFISGLEDLSITEIKKTIDKNEKELEKYKNLQKFSQISTNDFGNDIIPDDYVNNIDNYSTENPYNEVETRLNTIEIQKERLQRDVYQLEKSLNENRNFINFVEQHKIYVTSPSTNEEIPVNQKTIKNYNENSELLKIFITNRKVELMNLIEEEKELKAELRSEPTLFDDLKLEDYKIQIHRKIKGLGINYSYVDGLIAKIQNENKIQRTKIKELIQQKPEMLEKINLLLLELADELGVKKYVVKDGIFTKETKSIPGAVVMKLTFIFKVVLMKVFYKYTNIRLPLIIDTLRNSEFSAENSDKILKFLKRHLSDHQIIIASIYQYDNFFEKEILIEGRLINETEYSE